MAALGPFFAVDTHLPGATPPAGWFTMPELDGDVLLRRVEAVRSALAAGAGHSEVEERVAASVCQLGIVARVLAPALAASTLGLAPLSLDPVDVWWQDVLGGPVPLSVTTVPPGSTSLLDGAVTAVSAAVRDGFGTSVRVLWGNVGSAVASAARLIGAARPDRAEAAQREADAVLADPRIDGGLLRAGPGFRRRSCCLIYRVAGGAPDQRALCGDCVLGEVHPG